MLHFPCSAICTYLVVHHRHTPTQTSYPPPTTRYLILSFITAKHFAEVLTKHPQTQGRYADIKPPSKKGKGVQTAFKHTTKQKTNKQTWRKYKTTKEKEKERQETIKASEPSKPPHYPNNYQVPGIHLLSCFLSFLLVCLLCYHVATCSYLS
ncbi:hypothetical protein B0T22DRAFT_446277 [Podospora appendiculata]|uniref:Uncharacterized protein n=1 Tax=Podospora appendiculata TaxID=314037 RepID=A0AAE1CEX3_9PEZI|nr:hypothetical protein B0T22DRAFT_446277 [Podospora appendiculata]